MTSEPPDCRLYLKLPAKRSTSIENSFTQVIAQSTTQGCCVLLCRDAAGPDAAALGAAWADQALQLAHDRGVAFLVEGDVELARRIDADGVHIAADAAVYTHARERLGADAIIGAGCGQSRHDAMLLAERGVDYVAFEAPVRNVKPELASLIAWWAEIFVVPCVAFGVESAEEARQLAALGADFATPADSLWQFPNAAQQFALFAAALGQTRSPA
jgi:thiamine-phosphate pyrophosphorylase